MIYIHSEKQGSPEWHKLRSGKVTASNAHILLSKGKKEAMKPQKAFAGNFYTERGHTLEDEAIELYERISGFTCARVGFITNTNYPDCGYSPDAILPDRIIEVKAFNGERHLKAFEKPTINMLAQIHFGLMITELPIAILIMYNPDADNLEDKLKIKVLKRDLSIISNMETKLNA